MKKRMKLGNYKKTEMLKVSDYIELMRDKSIEEMVFDSPHSTRNEKCFPIVATRDFTVVIDFGEGNYWSKMENYDRHIASIYKDIKHYSNCSAAYLSPGKVTLNVKQGDIGGWMDEEAYQLNCNRFMSDESDLFWIFPNSFVVGKVRLVNSIIGDPAVIQLLTVHPKHDNVNLPTTYVTSTYKNRAGKTVSHCDVESSIISSSIISTNYNNTLIRRSIVTNKTSIVANDNVEVYRVILNSCRIYDRLQVNICKYEHHDALHIISKVYCDENEKEHDYYDYAKNPLYAFNKNNLEIYIKGYATVYNIAVTGSLLIKGQDIAVKNVGFINKDLVEITSNTWLYNTIISSQDDFYVVNNEQSCTIDYMSGHVLSAKTADEYIIADLYDEAKEKDIVTGFACVNTSMSFTDDKIKLYINRLRNINDVIDKTRTVNNDVSLSTVIDLGRYSNWSLKKGFSDNYKLDDDEDELAES